MRTFVAYCTWLYGTQHTRVPIKVRRGLFARWRALRKARKYATSRNWFVESIKEVK
jgi:hypothetical protein